MPIGINRPYSRGNLLRSGLEPYKNLRTGMKREMNFFFDFIVNLVAQHTQVLDFKVALEICPGSRGSPAW